MNTDYLLNEKRKCAYCGHPGRSHAHYTASSHCSAYDCICESYGGRLASFFQWLGSHFVRV